MARGKLRDLVPAQRLNRFELVIEGRAQRLDQQQFGDEFHRLPGEFGVAAFVNLYQALIGQVIAPSAIEIPYGRPEQPSIYEALMGCPVRFDAPCHALEVPVSLLAMVLGPNTVLQTLLGTLGL